MHTSVRVCSILFQTVYGIENAEVLFFSLTIQGYFDWNFTTDYGNLFTKFLKIDDLNKFSTDRRSMKKFWGKVNFFSFSLTACNVKMYN